MISAEGKAKVRLRVEGFASDLKQEVISVIFKDEAGEDVYVKKFGKQSFETQTKLMRGTQEALLI